MIRNKTDIATGITAPGWLPPFRMPSDIIAPMQSLQGLAEGAGAAFAAEIWISSFSNADESAPRGLVKLDPAFAAVATADFAQEASGIYLFDSPFLWLKIKVTSVGGSLSFRMVA